MNKDIKVLKIMYDQPMYNQPAHLHIVRFTNKELKKLECLIELLEVDFGDDFVSKFKQTKFAKLIKMDGEFGDNCGKKLLKAALAWRHDIKQTDRDKTIKTYETKMSAEEQKRMP